MNKLMAVAARPRDLLKNRNDGAEAEQLALDTLGSRLLAFSSPSNKLKASSCSRRAKSRPATPTSLAGRATRRRARPPSASYQVRPGADRFGPAARQPERSTAADDALGERHVLVPLRRFRRPGHLARRAQRRRRRAARQDSHHRPQRRHGRRSTSALRAPSTTCSRRSTTTPTSPSPPSTDGDSFMLTDNSGGSGNLTVQDVGSGTTAAGLAWPASTSPPRRPPAATSCDSTPARSSPRSTTATASQSAPRESPISTSTLSDGSTLDDRPGTTPTTLGDVITQINAADPPSCRPRSPPTATDRADRPDRRRRRRSASPTASTGTAADDLGIATDDQRRHDHRRPARRGPARHAAVEPQRRARRSARSAKSQSPTATAASTTVDLVAAETLGDVIDLINARRPRSPRRSTRPATASSSPTTPAAAATSSSPTATPTTRPTEARHRRQRRRRVGQLRHASAADDQRSHAALLAQRRQGRRPRRHSDHRHRRRRSRPPISTPSATKPKTVGDVIDAINALTNGVEARINDTGDGILLVDTADGTSTLGVAGPQRRHRQVAQPHPRQQDHRRRAARRRKVIDGTATYSIDLADLEVSSAAIPLSSLNGGSGVASATS